MKNNLKAVLSLFLSVAMVLSLASCAGGGADVPETSADAPEETTVPEESEPEENDPFAVASPMTEIPVYTFDREPTNREMRETIVRAMRDMLSVEWYTLSGFTYNKSGAVSDKTFRFDQKTHYMGLPYTNAQVNIYGFLEYYNKKTGAILEEKIQGKSAELGNAVNITIGNTCTGSTGWATAAVANSVRGGMVSYTLTQKNGFYPVGGYTYDEETADLYQATTTLKIIAENGEETMLKALSAVQMADLLVMNDTDPSTGHSMMAIADAETVYSSDGTIDADKSTIRIQDQRAGFYDQTDANGAKIFSSGRLDYTYTFRELLQEGYMPVAPAELLGTKAYEQPEFSLSKEVTTLNDMNGANLLSNYALSTVKVFVTGEDGKKQEMKCSVLGRNEIKDGSAFKFNLKFMAEAVRRSKALKPGTYTVTVEARNACGALFTALSISHTVE